MPTWDLKDRGGKREQRWQIVAEGRSVDPWLDAVSLDFSPLFLVVPVDCSLKRPSLPKVPPTLKATHRQVGAVEPRPQVLDSNPGEGHGPPLCSSAAPFPRVPRVSPVGFVPYYPLPYAGIPASPANPHTSFHCRPRPKPRCPQHVSLVWPAPHAEASHCPRVATEPDKGARR